MASTHSQQLERWLGSAAVEHLSQCAKGWYGPPIPVAGVPGQVYACGDGDFVGKIEAGEHLSAVDRFWNTLKRFHKRVRRIGNKTQFNAGASSLSDIIEAETTGRGRKFLFSKVGSTGVVGVTNSLWGLGTLPTAGTNASNAPGGDAPTDATSGAFGFVNPSGGDTQHIVSASLMASVAPNTLVLYDRLFQVNKTMNSTTAEVVTGVPTRYQNTNAGSVDSAEGNFLFVEVGGTALATTAHNWTVCQYTNQAGTTGRTIPSLTGNSGAIVRRLDHPASQWFAPLQNGDTGIRSLTQMQCSANVATGVINFVIGHVIAFMPCPLANFLCVSDYLNTAFGLTRIFDDAALGFLEACKPVTTSTTYNGQFNTIAT